MSEIIDDEEVNRSMGIFIDGCNVAECEFIDNGEVKNACKLGYWTDVLDYTPNCVNNKKCVFKKLALQLQRAKAENEKLINENRLLRAALKNKNFVAIAEENERLKKENEKLNAMTGIFSGRLMQKYKQALERINARILNENADDCLLDVKEIIDEVLEN